MTTPIRDFACIYAQQNTLRMHMPGHKGSGVLGIEEIDITEIDGADSLYEAKGIIAQSEANAGSLFGCDTFYSAEGSSQCIRAMLYLVCVNSQKNNGRITIMAGRNAHKTFLSAAALLDFDIEWLYGEKHKSYLSCDISAQYIEKMLQQAAEKPAAVYLTTPDYLGNMLDVKGIAEVCRKYGVLLVVDNAHGAYLRFLPQSQHPADLGADLCCDSAHKTLPVLTGGAYMHISSTVAEHFSPMAKNALVMFGSTSPSYLILQSLDAANEYIANGYSEKLEQFCQKIEKIKDKLKENGYILAGDEPLKITLSTKPYGYKGTEFARMLAEENIICEFSDPDFIVFMLTPEMKDEQLEFFTNVLCGIPKKNPVNEKPPLVLQAEKVISVREAAFMSCEEIDTEKAEGRVLAAATVGCPPAVPIVVCGERIDSRMTECFKYYGIEKCVVVRER